MSNRCRSVVLAYNGRRLADAACREFKSAVCVQRYWQTACYMMYFFCAAEPSLNLKNVTMTKEDFKILVDTLTEMGYENEIKWQRELQPCSNNIDFLWETCWVILNSGMKEQIARKIWERIQDAWLGERDISEVFRHTGKVAAIKYVKENSGKLFEGYVLAENKIEFLQTIPFIGKITCFHLAKNLGHDCVKPDRHLVRIAAKYNTTPDLLCENISNETGEKKCVVDIVIWRACNLQLL